MDVNMARSIGMCSLFLSLLLTACGNPEKTVVETFRESKAECAATAVPNRFLVSWNDGRVTVETARDRDTFIKEVLEPALDEIEFAEHDQIVSVNEPGRVFESATPTDPPDWGPVSIEAPAVWSQGIYGDGVVVAVVDSGLDLHHTQLKGQVFVNSSESLNGEDDDGNGYVDDVYGYDFAKKTGYVSDPTGHGTHVAGIIAADHSFGPVKGAAPKAKILPLGFIGADGGGRISDAILALEYAAARGARIVNASWGGSDCSVTLQRTVQSLTRHGVLFVTAAGNLGSNLDYYPEYPAAFQIEGQITVGAHTARNYSADFSNYSYSLVHLMAPGAAIYSTYPRNQSTYMSGTSMAAPFVAATAALIWSAHPDATLSQVRSALLESVTPGYFQVATRGRLNARKALETLRKLAP